MKLHSPMVRVNGEWVEVWVPTEHDDFQRNQVHSVLTFRPQGEWWEMRIHDDLIRHHPEAFHAAMGVAIKALHACTQAGA